MNGSELLDKMELIEPQYIEAAEVRPQKKRSWLKWAAAAAACVAAAIGAIALIPRGGSHEQPPQLAPIELSEKSTVTVEYGYCEPAEWRGRELERLVPEMLQYVGDGLKLKTIEAEAMYSGIMIDTNNFTTKTGVRTFEAAAFLKRCGADVTRIRKAFRTDMDEYIAKARAISTAEIFLEGFVLADCVAESVGSPTVLGAQVANELMDINGVKASFVFTEYNGQIYISARSIDEVNVQIIMEKLGGGGHMSVAGAQLSCSKDEAKQRVRDVLKEMSENKEI